MSHDPTQTIEHGPMNVTEFRFRSDNVHNRDMLEYQSEKAYLAGRLDVAASFAIASALYALIAVQTDGETPE